MREGTHILKAGTDSGLNDRGLPRIVADNRKIPKAVWKLARSLDFTCASEQPDQKLKKAEKALALINEQKVWDSALGNVSRAREGRSGVVYPVILDTRCKTQEDYFLDTNALGPSTVLVCRYEVLALGGLKLAVDERGKIGLIAKAEPLTSEELEVLDQNIENHPDFDIWSDDRPVGLQADGLVLSSRFGFSLFSVPKIMPIDTDF